MTLPTLTVLIQELSPLEEENISITQSISFFSYVLSTLVMQNNNEKYLCLIVTTTPFHTAEHKRVKKVKKDALQLGIQSNQLQWNLPVSFLNHTEWTSTRTKAAKDWSWSYHRLWDPDPPQKLALCKCTNPCSYFMCAHICTLLQSRSNTKKLKKKPPGSETNKPLFLTNLFIYACDQVIPHDFTRHFSSCSLFPNKSQKKSAKPNTGSFRYFLKTIWAMKLKVKAKSTAIHVFTGLCRGFQSNESYDKCTATLDTIL